MTRPASRVARRWLAGAAALALAGCASLFVATPPGNLYRLAAANDFPSNLPACRRAAARRPAASPGRHRHQQNRVEQVAALARLLRRFGVDRPRPRRCWRTCWLHPLRTAGRSPRSTAIRSGLRADFILRTEIRHFEAVYDAAGGPPRVWVAIIARLVAMPQRRIIAQARFEQRAPAAADNVPAVVAAFNTATDAALRDIVLWTLGNPALSRTRR